MGIGIEIDDIQELTHTIEIVGRYNRSVAWAAVRAGVRVYLRAIKAVVRGSIRNEVGVYSMGKKGGGVEATVGFRRFPRPGDGQNGPHGVYLEHGTKYIAPDHAVANALMATRGAALSAMTIAAETKLEQLATPK